MRRKSHGVVQEVTSDGTIVRSRLTQPGAARIVDEARQLRGLPQRKSDFMQHVAVIPHLHKEILKRERPEVFREVRAMEKFLNSSEGRIYRTRPKGGASNRIFTGKSRNGR